MKERCPIHGILLPQSGGAPDWEFLECPRRDCDVIVILNSATGSVAVDSPPELNHLKTNINATILEVLAALDDA